jgi:hypothetical protein
MTNILVARGGLFIATLNNVVAIGETLYCHVHCFIGMRFLPHRLFVAIAYIATPYDYANSPYCNALFGTCQTIYDE